VALFSLVDGHAIPLQKELFPKNIQTLAPDRKAVDQQLVASLLDELQNLFALFQDGIVKDDTFVGGLPMSYLNADGSLDALTLDESKQIWQALTESITPSDKTFGFSLTSFIKWIPFFKENGDNNSTGNKGLRLSPALIDSDGYSLPLPEKKNLNALIQARLDAQGLPQFCAYWYAISEKLQTKRHEEIDGDLTLIDANRKKLIAKRINATPFEQAVQQFSAHVSSRFCDTNGDILSPESLEQFTNELINYLLEKTKLYWPRAPLLLLFDAIVVPVLRPMLYPHITWTSEYNYLSEGGALDVKQFANKRTSFETMPAWNDSAQQQALRFVEEVLNHHLSFRFLGLRIFDAFSQYNREVLSSVHMDPSGFRGKTKSFGPPVHTQDVMQLVRPIPKEPEEKILDKVMTYRSVEEGVWH